jgi:hypothetical protein
MTEAEWQTSSDPVQMLFAFDDLPATDRQMLLFAVACWTRLLPVLTKKDQRVLAAVAGYIEGAVSLSDVQASKDGRAPRYKGRFGEVQSLRAILPSPNEPRYVAESSVVDAANLAAINIDNQGTAFRAEQVQQITLLRDIFGNPYRKRPVLKKGWRSHTVFSLASQMYESRDFGEMPILADALQDAGWDIDDALNHCRGPGPHVRGCWVVDLVLGKE